MKSLRDMMAQVIRESVDVKIKSEGRAEDKYSQAVRNLKVQVSYVKQEPFSHRGDGYPSATCYQIDLAVREYLYRAGELLR
jgi:hypothetical protein